VSSQGSVRQRHNARCPVDLAGGHTPHRCRGTWWWVLDLGPDPLTGKRRQPSKSGFATRREAQVDLAAARATLAVTGGRGAGLTVGAWLDDWLASLHTASPTTIARYEGILRLHLKPILGQLLLADLAPEHVDRLLRTVASPGYVAPGLDRRHQATAGPQSSASVKRIFAVLRRALVVAARRRLIPWNPAAAVEPPEETNKPGTAWTPEQAGRFLDSTNGERLGAAWRLALTTGDDALSSAGPPGTGSTWRPPSGGSTSRWFRSGALSTRRARRRGEGPAWWLWTPTPSPPCALTGNVRMTSAPRRPLSVRGRGPGGCSPAPTASESRPPA